MKKRLLFGTLFVFYILTLLKVMVFKEVPILRFGQLQLNFGGTNGNNPANLVPLRTIIPYLLGEKGWLIAGINLLGNIVFLVPLGFLLPFLFPRIRKSYALLIALCSGLAIEGLQALLRVGIFDIDDVLLNALGALIGYFACLIFLRWMAERRYLRILAAICCIILASVALLFTMYPRNEPVNPQAEFSTERRQSAQVDVRSQNTTDLCGGTGGTGTITQKEQGEITIESKTGNIQKIGIDDQTSIKTASGAAKQSDLSIGQHVTIVILDGKTATDILVCNSDSSK